MRSYVVPGEVRTIGDWAFAGCRELARIALPSGIERIGRDAFQGCDKLEEAFVYQSEGSFCEEAARSEAERVGAGLLALALRYFPEASILLATMREGGNSWTCAWDEACKKFLEEEDAVGFRPFLAGGEEDYEDAAKALEEHCRKKRLIKA
ncbi:MAG: leucine-rich repeat protein, partial [Lachnospiraceae bacterium]|nr:leucine-rich repeat protein [Lachnospiraceae bacterium]